MFHRGWFWMDAHSSSLDRRILDVVRRYSVAREGRVAQALAEVPKTQERWAGLICEVQGKAADTLLELREQVPGLPMLAILTPAQLPLVDRLQSSDIEVAFSPLDEERLHAFVRRAYSRAFVPSERVSRAVGQLATRAQLTAREVQLLTYCLAHETRAVVQKRLGISENTLKTQVRGLLRKCEAPSVDALAKSVLRDALMVDLSTLESVGDAALGDEEHAA
jgi:DNA-binding NarL/FixJ family response regulator